MCNIKSFMLETMHISATCNDFFSISEKQCKYLSILEVLGSNTKPNADYLYIIYKLFFFTQF